MNKTKLAIGIATTAALVAVGFVVISQLPGLTSAS
jgi:hypothetical protein